MPSSTARTRHAPTLLLDAAERLFAERGIDAVSMREIGLAAGQRNNGVTQYYFGDKDGLVRAVFERRSAVVNERRLALVEELRQHPPINLLGVVSAHVTPLAEQILQGTPYVRFLSRLGAEGRRREMLGTSDTSVYTAYDPIASLVAEQLPHLPAEVVDFRWQLAINLTISALADFQNQMLARSGAPSELGRRTDQLIDAVVGLLLGPATDPDLSA